MRTIIAIAAAAAAVSLLPIQASAQDAYAVDADHAWVTFKTNHAGWADAHGLFRTVSGEIQFDRENVANSSIELRIEAASIDTNNERRDTHLRSPDFFNVEEFPEITFESTTIEQTGERTANVTGDLTLLGTTEPVTLAVTWNEESPLPWDANTIKTGFSATGSFSGLDFGMTSLTQYGLGPDVELDIDIEAVRQ